MQWDVKQIRSRSLVGIARVLNVTLVLTISYTLANIVLNWMHGQNEEGLPISRKISEKTGDKSSASANASRQNVLAGLNLFGGGSGILPNSATGTESGNQALPETRLEIQIIGIFFSEGPGNNGRALIKTGPDEERTYRVDEQISGGIRIKKILTDHVILERDGQSEILRLPKSALSANQVGQGKNPAQSQKKTSSSSDLLRKLRDQLRLSPESVLEMVRIDPYYVGGKFEGFKLQPGKDAGFLKQFGLEAGDVVFEVNDVQMTDPLKGMEAMAQLASAHAISLRVKRGINIVSYEFSLDQ
ncbi:MAG: hypothetical protein H7833_15705 [Magnetococcus sp. DMHC-1]|nr:hypothetical protein [Magnetococcales bacterium]